MNSIFTIVVRKENGLWVFDDTNKGLHREPFVAGSDIILDRIMITKGFPIPKMVLVFSSFEFPGHSYKFTRGRPEADGFWYDSPFGMDGWLCPAMFKYFDEAPEHIYLDVKYIE